MSRPATLMLIAVGGAIVIAISASAAGWLGGVVVCGADRSVGCVTWPTAISEVIWGAFILGVLALVVWQARSLRR